MPFDRLIRAIDRWAGDTGREDVFAQVGDSDFRPRHIEYVAFLDSQEFRERVVLATAVVAHAGMGSILTALELGKPILVMPRRGDLQETRNDHQIATARQLEQQGRVMVAYDETELIGKLNLLGKIGPGQSIQPYASEELLSSIRDFILNGAAVPR